MSFNGCSTAGGNPFSFPCNADAIQAVSLGIGAGGVSLIFVYYLYKQVRA